MEQRDPIARLLTVVSSVCGALVAAHGVSEIVEAGAWHLGSPAWDAASVILGGYLLVRGLRGLAPRGAARVKDG